MDPDRGFVMVVGGGKSGWFEEPDVCYGCLEGKKDARIIRWFVKVRRLRADVKSEE